MRRRASLVVLLLGILLTLPPCAYASPTDPTWIPGIYFAILKYGGDDTPNLGEGTSTKGVHHIGFYVDDLEQACATLESASATECQGSSKVNRKYKGPDGLMIDVRARGWDEQIKARMPLYQLTTDLS
ncbi:MAG: hypothetical protein DME05_01220 [Candidatus Rokuibacteriota bacterium]|nr:MAG: hypothetical protein DME05_01220 [Candidatus Rokubacteria bacterium]